MDDYLSKPFRIADLQAVLQRWPRDDASSHDEHEISAPTGENSVGTG